MFDIILYFWLRIAGKNTNLELYFYNCTKLVLKDIDKDFIYCNSNNWNSWTFCNDAQFYTGASLSV